MMYLLGLGKEYISRIPKDIWNIINEKRKESENIPQKQKINKDSVSLIAYIHYKYLTDSEEEKNKLRKLLSQNEKIYQEELKQRYNINVFENISEKSINKAPQKELIAVQEKKGIINRLINFFRKLGRFSFPLLRKLEGIWKIRKFGTVPFSTI